MKTTLAGVVLLLVCVSLAAQTPFLPQPILPGGQVIAVFPPGSPFLKADRMGEAETLNMMRGVPGRIQSIVNIHNPSIEVHVADPAITIIHPQDAMGETLADSAFRSLWPTVFQTEQKLGANDRLRFAQGLKDVH